MGRRRRCPASRLKSSSVPMRPKASRSCQGAGWSRELLLGSVAVEDWPRTGRTSIAKRSPSCASLQSASCSENFVIPPEVIGQTLREIEQQETALLRLLENCVALGVFTSRQLHAYLFLFGIGKRTLAQSAGFRAMIEVRNFVCGAGLLWMQIDTAMRLNAIHVAGDIDSFLDAWVSGKKIRTFDQSPEKRCKITSSFESLGKSTIGCQKYMLNPPLSFISPQDMLGPRLRIWATRSRLSN